jgi:NAD(P)-dependent dehydrogenase (short-subunit alcohol dehydrogenase family)
MSYLTGKNAIVTGAAVGLGKTYATLLAREGTNVAICDIRPEVADVAKELEGMGVRALAFEADVSKAEDVQRVVDGTLSAFGSIDVLIANAGIWRGSMPDDDLDKSLDDYDVLIGTNLKGVYMFGRAVIPHMIANGGCHIINISSDHVHTHPGRPTGGGFIMYLYDASKWGVLGLTLAWAKALKEKHIRVNAFSMGATDSYMLRSFNNFPGPEVVATWMKPEEVCGLAIELINQGPDGATGENYPAWLGFEVELSTQPRPKAVVAAAGGA